MSPFAPERFFGGFMDTGAARPFFPERSSGGFMGLPLHQLCSLGVVRRRRSVDLFCGALSGEPRLTNTFPAALTVLLPSLFHWYRKH